MLRKITGVVLIIIGAICILLFLQKDSHQFIPYPIIGHVLGGIIIAAGSALYSFGPKKPTKAQKLYLERLARLRQNGEQIVLNSESCQIRENNYYKEAVNDNPQGARGYTQKYIEQSAIIYYYTIGGEKIRMTSQAFPYNATILAGFIENNMIVLYVNRFDKNDYAFGVEGTADAGC